jgi:outer membrane receptor protein involved in Fe transport
MVNFNTKKLLLFLLFMLLLWCGEAYPQSNFTLRGKVTGADARALFDVSIAVKGSNRGTSSSAAGEFTIEAKKGDVLILSYVGYGTQEFTVTDSKSIDITMTATGGSLNEVVVTALGIRRERKSLGYSVTEVKGEELTQAREVNVASSLEGKVAGLNVSTVSGGAGSSSNVIIRGLSSLSPNTQTLYVVNGVPMEMGR